MYALDGALEKLAQRGSKVRGVSGFIALIIMLELSIPPVAAAQSNERMCEKIDSRQFASPDDVWQVEVYGEVCDQGLYSSAAVVVALERGDAPSITQTVLGMDLPSDESDWPVVAWTSSSELLIVLPASARIGLQVAYFQGINVEVQYCPSTARNDWLAYWASSEKWLAQYRVWAETKRQEPASDIPEPESPVPPPRASTSECAPAL